MSSVLEDSSDHIPHKTQVQIVQSTSKFGIVSVLIPKSVSLYRRVAKLIPVVR